MFTETLKELQKADSKTSYNLSIKILAEGRCQTPLQRLNNFQSLEGRKQWHPNMVFLWGPDLRSTGLQLVRLCMGYNLYGHSGIKNDFVDLQLTTIIKVYLGFKNKKTNNQPANNRYQCSLFNKSFVISAFSCMNMYMWYACINVHLSYSMGTHV